VSEDIRYKVETTLGTPAGDGPVKPMPIEEQLMAEYDGDITTECPSCFVPDGGMVRTEKAQVREVHPTLIRWTGVPCDKCDKTYTLEAALLPPEAP
jgi:hypothetical protein